MSATEIDETAGPTDEPGDRRAQAGHPTPRLYVQIALVLAVLTALEISTAFVDFGAVAIPLLVILMAIKFVLVAGFFMHLRFDTRIYTRVMGAGLVLAATVYTVALLTFLNVTPAG